MANGSKEQAEDKAKRGKDCPMAALLNGKNCPFLERFFKIEKDIEVLRNDIKWLKELLVPIFIGTMSLLIKLIIEVIFGG